MIVGAMGHMRARFDDLNVQSLEEQCHWAVQAAWFTLMPLFCVVFFFFFFGKPRGVLRTEGSVLYLARAIGPARAEIIVPCFGCVRAYVCFRCIVLCKRFISPCVLFRLLVYCFLFANSVRLLGPGHQFFIFTR
ncbi:uncharacterized protein EI90DRAFT_2566396 [Cantharellus anzutake]|uniref:uncharacterized protein n=1 Tax=Cantharellus anzutake TaxID=1750568 RepID=UPI001906576F|nr:uncharacterized protein EI90DRAFT_2566396 [Cantharellus anzutake]KAF8338256.1 hypothetical protein EI90DRAFT_2566396 [Cantharellus anzutake]